MAGTVDLLNFLTNDELTTLPDSIRTKIESHVTTLTKESDAIKSKYEKLRVNSEQQHFDVEKQLISSNTKLESESTSNTQLKEQIAELEKQYNEASEKLKASQAEDEGTQSTKLHLTKINDQLQSDKREIASLLEKRNREIDNLNDELKGLSKKLSQANASKIEALTKLDEVSSNQMSRELVVKRLEQEQENLKTQIQWLDKDLKDKTRDLVNVRRDNSSKLLEVQAKFEEKSEECSLLKSTVESLRQTSTDQATKIDQLIQRNKDTQDSHSQAEEQYRQEIQARIRLVDLYKNSAQEAENKATELTGAVTELQKLLQEAATATTDLENEKDDEIQTWKDEVEKREKKIGNLEQELVNANDLLSAMKHKGVSEDRVETMFPTAAATSKLLKSGMSLTQIYNEYVNATDSLQFEREENKRLNTYLDQILQEIEQKAPLLKKQREDYDIALKSIDQMTRQLDAAMVDCQNLRAETDESNRKSGHLTKENQKQQLQIKDLSDQVKYLVKEVEELQGGRLVRDEVYQLPLVKFLVKEVEELQGGRVVRDEVSSAEISSSSRVISDKLVTFRNIEELQEQNQKLLSVIRELSDKHEQEENEAVDTKTRELSAQLEMAQEELTVLKDARTRQAEMVESIVRQRDMYRVLLQQANAAPLPMPGGQPSIMDTSSASPVKQRNPEQEKKLEETNEALKQLQADFAAYKKDKLGNDKMLNEQMDKDRKEMSDLRLQNAKLASELNFTGERFKVLQGNAESYKKEISKLQDKIQKYNTTIAKYEQTVNSLKQEIMSSQEQVSQLQSREENLRREKDLIRSSEMRLQAEMDSMRRERNSQSMLMANLQAIQNNLERAEHETKQSLGRQMETLEREKTYLKKRLETEERQHGSVVKHLENQSKENRQSLDMELKAHQATKSQLSNTKKELQETKHMVESTAAQLSSAEARLANLSAQETAVDMTSEEIRDLNSQLTQARAEISRLQAQTEKLRGHLEQYKKIDDGLQQTIQEQNKTSEEFKESMEETLREATENVDHLKSRLDSLETERQELLNENIRITEDSHNLNADLRKQLTSLQNELQEAVERREAAVSVETQARSECDAQTKVAADAQDKYERELMLHAASVEALTEVKQKLEGHGAKLEKVEERARVAEKKLEDSKTSWEQREKLLIDEKDRLAARVTDLIGQTRCLHDQMGKLSTQVITQQERAVTAGQARAGGSGVAASKIGTTGAKASEDESNKSSEQLLEVIKFLRKEKDIAESRLDVVETESLRLKQRCDSLEVQVENANQDLSEERRKAQAEIQTAAQHADLMLKVESYNLLQDSNKLMREEKEHLQAKVTELEAKLSKLEERIRPLQEENRELAAQRDSLTSDKKAIAGEVERWRSRTQQLIETAHRTDPEEHKKLIQEKEDLRKQVNSITEDLHKAKAESTKNAIEIAKLQRQMTVSTDEKNKFSEELKKKTDNLEEKEKDLAEKLKTITQLKKIGRKYKEQAESVNKEFDEYKAKYAEQEKKQTSQQSQAVEAEQKLKEESSKREAAETALKGMTVKCQQLEKTVTDNSSGKSVLEDSLNELQTKKTSMEQQLTTMANEKRELEQRLQNVESGKGEQLQEVSKLREELTQHKATSERLSKVEQEKNKLAEEKAEIERKLSDNERKLSETSGKLTKMTSMLQAAKNKLTSLKEMNEKLTAERLEMKKKISSNEQASNEEAEARVASMKSLYESSTQKLEKDVAAKTEEIAELQAKITELQAKIQQLQSSQKLGAGQSQVPPTRATGSVAAEARSSSTSEMPKTANIRPIASSPAAIKPQTVPVQPQAQSAASKATASIRPMAIAPTSVSPMTSGTPTATVMPTTVTQQEQQMEGDAVSPVQQLFPTQSSRPTQQVQRVIPTQESSSSQDPEPGSSTETGIVEPQPSSSRETAVAPVSQTNKRQREETESPGDDSTVNKRTKVTNVEESQTTIPEIKVTDESAAPVTQVVSAQEPQDDDDDDNADIVEEDIQEQGGSQHGDDDSDNGIIVLGSDEEPGEEEDEDEDDEDNEDEEGDEDDEEEEEDDDDDDENYDQDGIEYIEETQEEEVEVDDDTGYSQQDEGMGGSSQQQPDDDDVVIIDLGEEDEGDMGSDRGGEPDSQPSSQPSSQASLLPPLQPLMPERQLSVTRNQLAPFMIGGSAGFEDLDDCTVPSTPTLTIPRGGDGFAEAISSPQVPASHRFVFGSGGSEHGLTLSGLAQLDSQAGMGMDDTRMDLSQLEEGSGRSVPSTPLHTSAPATIISDTTDTGPGDSTAEQGEGQGRDETDHGQQLEEEALEGEADMGEDMEGELGEEDFQPEILETDESQDKTGDGGEASSSQMDSPASGDRSQEAGKPKIQKIVWDAPITTQAAPTPPSAQPIPSMMSQPIPTLGTPTQQYRPARGTARGMPQSRGPGGPGGAGNRGSFSRGQPRGGRPMRGGRGGMFTRRPPMY